MANHKESVPTSDGKSKISAPLTTSPRATDTTNAVSTMEYTEMIMAMPNAADRYLKYRG